MSGLFARAMTYAVSGLAAQGIMFAFWLMLPWYLPPVEIGRLTLALFSIELLTAICMMGMDSAVVRFAALADLRKRVLAAAFLVVGVASLAVFALVFLLLALDLRLFADATDWLLEHPFLILAVVATNLICNLYQSAQVAAREAKVYAIFQFVRSLAYFLIGIVMLAVMGKVAVAVISAAMLSSLVALSLLPKLRGMQAISFMEGALAETKRLFAYGFPLMLYALFGVGVAYTQRLLVNHYIDIVALGIYGFFTVIALQANGLWSAFNKAWTPEFFHLVEQDRAQAHNLLRGMLILVIAIYPLILAVYVMLAEAFLNELLIPHAYVQDVEILYLLLLGPLFTGIYSVAYPLYYHDLRTRRILNISIVLAVVNLLLSMVFIKTMGMLGASFSYALLAMLAAWVYLWAYPGWRDGGSQRLMSIMLMATALAAAAALLLVFGGVPEFVTVLVAISVMTWVWGGETAKPLLNRFVRTHRVA